MEDKEIGEESRPEEHPILKRVCGFCGGSGVVKVNEHKKVWCQICRGQGFKIVRR